MAAATAAAATAAAAEAAAAAAAAAHHERSDVHHPLPLLLQRAPVALPRLAQRHGGQHHKAERHVACAEQSRGGGEGRLPMRQAGSEQHSEGGGRRRRLLCTAAWRVNSCTRSHDVRRKGKRKPYTPSDHLFSKLRLELRLRQGGRRTHVGGGPQRWSRGPQAAAAARMATTQDANPAHPDVQCVLPSHSNTRRRLQRRDSRRAGAAALAAAPPPPAHTTFPRPARTSGRLRPAPRRRRPASCRCPRPA